jgi:mannose-1-phosphate guanylyltransferase
METLTRYRTGGEQKVTVQQVSVSEGGQAIVGNVTQAAREAAPEQAGNAVKATIILEPQRRDSAAAIAAASELAMKKDPAAILLVVAAEHLIPNTEEFTGACAARARLLSDDEAELGFGDDHS